MAVHKRSYRGYDGQITPLWSRFLIVTRYAFKNVFQSKLVTAVFVICFFVPLTYAVGIYVNHNTALLAMFRAHSLFEVDAGFFFYFLTVQKSMAFILTALVGPGLVSPDLANSGLPLYFCRPLSRAEYVAGKIMVLVSLLSLITWVPGLLLFLIQSSLAGGSWMWANLWLMGSIFLGSAIEILVFSVLAMALSAWIKRKLAAGAALLAVFFLGAGFGEAANKVLGTDKGILLNLGRLIATVEAHLFRQPWRSPISSGSAWTALLALSAFCLWLLARKVRAYEVVRG
jgi:ABC-2 type transport system permease protein